MNHILFIFFLNCFDSPGWRDTLWVYSMWLLEFHVTFRISLSSSTSQVALQYELHGISKSIWGVSEVKSSVVSDSSRPHGLQPTRPFRPRDFSKQEYWSGCHCLLQEISWELLYFSNAYFRHRHINMELKCMCMFVLVAQWCPTLCDPMDCSLPGSPVHGILQARILEWVAMPFSKSWGVLPP